jgi:tRNA pseudouridine55 synthase
LGFALESGAYLVGLKRTRIGDLRLEDAWALEDFMELLKADKKIVN